MDKETLTLIIGIITAMISLVAAVGVLLVNAKVDRLTGRVDALQAVITSFVTKSRYGLSPWGADSSCS